MLVHESPRLSADGHEYLGYDDHAPPVIMESDMHHHHTVAHERPSLLAYRPSLAMRSVWAPAAANKHTRYVPTANATVYRGSMSSRDSVWTTDDEDLDHSRRIGRHHQDTDDDDDEGKEEEEDDSDLLAAHTSHHHNYGHDDDDDEEDDDNIPMVGDVPLLEVDDDEPEKEVDTILGDLTRLPRTTVIDEDGFLIDPRASMADTVSSTASSASLVRPGVVIKSGLLFKQGFGFMNGGWKVRFVQLTSSKLTFFKEENGRKRGEIDLAKCSVKSIEIMPRDSVFDGAQATMWRFAIKHKGRRVMMSAYSEAEMKDWLRCFHVALAVQSAGAGRFTDLVVPNGTLLAGKGDGLMRASGSGLLR